MNYEQFITERWAQRPPDLDELLALGLDSQLSFGLEFEFYTASTRERIARDIRETLGFEAYAETWNNHNRDYWVIKTDGSLGGDGDYEYEYDCENCECDPECDGACAENGAEPESYACYACGRRANMPYPRVEEGETNPARLAQQAAYEAFCDCQREHHYGSDLTDPLCATHCGTFSYDCSTCGVDAECDHDCSYHCEGERVYYDGGRYGVEIASPPLRGEAGIAALWEVLRLLNENHAPLCNRSCGLHVHLGRPPGHNAPLLDHRGWQRLTALYFKYEDALDRLMPEERRDNNCDCARSLFSMLPNDAGSRASCPDPNAITRAFSDISSSEDWTALKHILRSERYLKYNLTSYDLHGTIEFRQHEGTTNFAQTLMWLLLLMRFLNLAERSDQAVSTTKTLARPDDLFNSLYLRGELRSYWQARKQLYAAECKQRSLELTWQQQHEERIRRTQENFLAREEELLRAYERQRAVARREYTLWSLHAQQLQRDYGAQFAPPPAQGPPRFDPNRVRELMERYLGHHYPVTQSSCSATTITAVRL
jgi:hypothetical protein